MTVSDDVSKLDSAFNCLPGPSNENLTPTLISASSSGKTITGREEEER